MIDDANTPPCIAAGLNGGQNTIWETAKRLGPSGRPSTTRVLTVKWLFRLQLLAYSNLVTSWSPPLNDPSTVLQILNFLKITD